MKARTLFVCFLSMVFVLGCSVVLHAEGIDDITAGAEAEKKGDYDEAINLYTKAIKAEGLNDNLIIVYVRRGRCYEEKEMLNLAVEDYTKAISLEPTNALHFTSRGIVYSKMKYWDRAIEDFTEAIKLNPGNISAYKNRGVAYQQKGLRELAEQDFLRTKLLGTEF